MRRKPHGEDEFTEVIMLNVTLFTRGIIHQGDSRFSNISRGRQCAFVMCKFEQLLFETFYPHSCISLNLNIKHLNVR